MRLSSLLRAGAFVAALLTAAGPATAQVEGLGYRLAPSGTYVFFDGDAALGDGLLYGGGGGLSFGEFLELNGSYLFGPFQTDFSGFSGTEGDPDLAAALAALPARDVDVQRYGGELKLNLATGAVVPFLTGGAGIVRFSPDGQEASRSLYLLGGAGLQFSLADRYGLSVSADAFGYRYNPGTAFFSGADLDAAGLGLENFNQVEVINPSVRAALSVYLGGRRPGELSAIDREFQRQFSGGLSGLSLVVEPFYGRTDFDDAFNYSDQTFVGGEAGFDLGPLVGVRGFYGRGVESGDPTSFEDIQMYGGDVRLRLNAGDGLIPFLTVGAGYLDVLSGYADTFDDNPEVDRSLAEDRPFAVGGGGIELPIGRRLRAIGEVRALVMSTQDEGDVSRPDDVYFSPSYRAGLSFGLGGSSGSRVAVVRQEDLARERAEYEAALATERAVATAREAELQAAIEQARLEGDSLAVARLRAQQTVARAQTAALPAAPAAPGTVMLPREVRTNQGDRIVTVPLPENGELYVRYGDPGGVNIESATDGTAPLAQRAPAPAAAPGITEAEIREIIRSALRESQATQNGAPLTENDVAMIERRIEDRIADRVGERLRDQDRASSSQTEVERLERRMEDQMREIRQLLLQMQSAPQQPVIVGPQGAVTPVAPQGDTVAVRYPERPVVQPLPEAPAALRSSGVYAVSPTVGFGLGRTDNLLAGLRLEYASGGALTYVPEILIGVTGRRSFTANLDATFGLPVQSFEAYGAPYLRGGIGLVNRGADDGVPDDFDSEVDDGGTALTLNLGLGANLAVGGGRFFVDFTTGNLGKYNRFTTGYRFPFGNRLY